MPKTRPAYPAEFRREGVQMLRAGRMPRELAESLGMSEQTLRKLASPGSPMTSSSASSRLSSRTCSGSPT